MEKKIFGMLKELMIDLQKEVDEYFVEGTKNAKRIGEIELSKEGRQGHLQEFLQLHEKTKQLSNKYNQHLMEVVKIGKAINLDVYLHHPTHKCMIEKNDKIYFLDDKDFDKLLDI